MSIPARAAGTPMSIARRVESPAPDAPHSRPLLDLDAGSGDEGGGCSGGGSSDGEATTHAELARGAAARSPSLGSPSLASPMAAERPLAAAAASRAQRQERAASHLAAGSAAAHTPVQTPLSSGRAGAARAHVQHPASPLEKVIDLMLEPPSPDVMFKPRAEAEGAEGAAPGTPSVLGSAFVGGEVTPASAARRVSSGRGGEHAMTPEQRVIDLMMHAEVQEEGEGAEEKGREGWRGGRGEEADSEGEDDEYGGEGGFDSEEDSGDEIAVDELEALCAEAAAVGAGGAQPDMSPIADIIGLVLATPKGRSTAGTGRKGAKGPAGEEEVGTAGPRVLFADD